MSHNIAVPDLNMPRVVVIGGGFGGIQVVKTLRNKDVQVVLLDKNNYHTFQPLLYQVATAGLEPDSIAFPLRKLFKKYRNFSFRNALVKQIHPERKEIETDIGHLNYDYLIVATGSATNFFGQSQIEQFAMPLKNVVQALDLRHLMLQNFEKALLTDDMKMRDSYMHFVIVGAGPTGVELAGALGELKKKILPQDYPELDVRRMQVHLLEAGPRVLPALSEASSLKSQRYLKQLGVQVWLNTPVEAYDGLEVTAHNKTEDKRYTIYSRNFIWSAGVQGNLVDGLDESHIVRGNRLKVNQFNEIEGLDKIYAVGDVASMRSEEYPKGHPMVAPVAMQQGQNVAKNILLELAQKAPKPFEYFDKGSMATVGRNKAVVEIGKLKFKGFFAWLVWMFVHIMSLVGFRNKLIVFINWVWNYINYDRGIRLIIRPFRFKSREVRRDLEQQESMPHSERE